MRVGILYPPFLENGKRPLLGQNRQFRYSSSSEVKIYPLIPATAATFAWKDGHEVLWLDGMNDLSLPSHFDETVYEFRPDVVLMETKAPLVKKHWDYARRLKERLPHTIVAFCGDHVSFFPEETLRNSPADYVLVGGYYDYIFSKLVEYLSGREERLPGGCVYNDGGEIKTSGDPERDVDLDLFPQINRELTRWRSYGEAYLKKPAAYILSGRGCKTARGAAVCSFCIWQHAFWHHAPRLRSPGNVVQEIKLLVEEYGVAEIFDDNESGPIWDVEWLREFTELMHNEGLVGKVEISANARADLLSREVCRLLKDANFRLLKVGIESGSDRILRDIIQKKETVEEIKRGIKNAKDAGLIVHMTNMVGYPGETETEVQATLEMARELLLYKTRAGDSLQASVLVPYPGTPLWKRAVRENWFLIDPHDYEKFDMAHVLIRSNLADPMGWCHKLWKLHLHPKFILRSLLTARSGRDLGLLLTGFRSLLGHLRDF